MKNDEGDEENNDGEEEEQEFSLFNPELEDSLEVRLSMLESKLGKSSASLSHTNKVSSSSSNFGAESYSTTNEQSSLDVIAPSSSSSSITTTTTTAAAATTTTTTKPKKNFRNSTTLQTPLALDKAAANVGVVGESSISSFTPAMSSSFESSSKLNRSSFLISPKAGDIALGYNSSNLHVSSNNNSSSNNNNHDNSFRDSGVWALLNKKLAHAGINRMITPADFQDESSLANSILDIFSDLLGRYSRRGHVINELSNTTESANKRESRLSDALQQSLERCQTYQSKVEIAENKIRVLEQEKHDLVQAHKKELQKCKRELADMAQKVSHSEMQVKDAWSQLEKLKSVLDQVRSNTSSNQKSSPNSLAGLQSKKKSVRNQSDNTRHNTPPMILEAYSRHSSFLEEIEDLRNQRDFLSKELELVKKENSRLGSALRKNIYPNESLDPSPAVAASAAELAARPSLAEWNSAQARIRLLEAKLKKSREDVFEYGRQSTSNESAPVAIHTYSNIGAGRLQSGRNVTVESAVESELRTRMENWATRSGLDEATLREQVSKRVGSFSTEIFSEIVHESCLILCVKDPKAIPNELKKLILVSRGMRRLRLFLREICDFVMIHGNVRFSGNFGEDLLEDPSANPEVLARVLPQISEWYMASKEYVTGANNNHKSPLLLNETRTKVSEERPTKTTTTAAAAAGNILPPRSTTTNNEEVFSKVVAHFMHLFDLDRLDSVYPKMTELFRTQNEVRNMLTILRSILDLPPSSSIHSIVSRVEETLHPVSRPEPLLRSSSTSSD